ncbi:MAG: hypothetical protein ACOCYT_05135 [Chloroflexota bacterium]
MQGFGQCPVLTRLLAGVVLHIRQVRLPDAWHDIRFHLDVMEEGGQLIINLRAGEIDVAAGDAVVGNAIGGARLRFGLEHVSRVKRPPSSSR